jgi:uncharacterized protein
VSTINAQPPSPAPVRRLGWPEIGIATVGWLGASILGSWVLVICFPTPSVALGVSIQAVVNLAVVGLALAVRVRSLAPLRLGGPGRRWLLVGLAAGIGLKLVTTGVVLAWQALTGDTTNPQQFFFDGVTAGGWSLAVVLVAAGLLIPVSEELLNRGILYGALRRYGPVAAGLGSAAVFALFHVVPLVMIVAFVLGVVNAVLVERSGSIWPAVVAHATLNTSGLVAAAFLL